MNLYVAAVDFYSWEMALIGLVAMLTAILSAVAGLGGGLILLTVLAQFFPTATAIPIQGGIQLISNGSRSWILREGINWPVVARASVLLMPASLLGVAVGRSIPESGTRLILGVFVLIVAWRPSLLRWRGTDELPPQVMYGIGAASGFLNTTVGASGPFTSPFFKAVTVTHAAFVATAATSQVLAHIAKLVAFSLDDFAPAEHLHVIAVGAVGVIVGSLIGSRLLGRFDERQLGYLFKVVLTLLALRLIIRSGIF